MSEQGRKYDSVLSAQHGGKHYKEKGIQPIEYAHSNELSFFQGNVVKYVTRYKDKKGVEDVKKAIHYLQMILEFEYGVFSEVSFSDAGESSETYKNPFSGSDISQEELKSFIESVDNPASQEALWYPPVEEGENPWIEYDSSGQPVSDDVRVQWLNLSERIDKSWEEMEDYADTLNWEKGTTLVAYRIVD